VKGGYVFFAFNWDVTDVEGEEEEEEEETLFVFGECEVEVVEL
jgi:hypothetical protein